MRALFKLLNSYFWRTIYGPFIALVLPIILLVILGNIERIEYILPGIISMSIMFLGVIALPLALMELKTSSLYKYIGVSRLGAFKLILTVILFYSFISLISTILMILTTLAAFKDKVFEDSFQNGILSGIFSLTGSFNFLLSLVINIAFSLSVGLVIATFSKTPQQALTVGFAIALTNMFLSGMVLSVDVIGESKVLNWVSRFMIFRYSTGNMVIAATPLNQTKDLLQALTKDELGIIFKFGNPDKHAFHITYDDAKHAMVVLDDNNSNYQKVVNSYKELKTLELTEQRRFNDLLVDSTLYNLVFGDSNPNIASIGSGSSNNLFDWLNVWGVRRVPEQNAIKEFVQKYFSNGDNSDSSERFATIFEKIKSNNYKWLNIFFKQTKSLYFTVDRILNVILPVFVTNGAILYSSHYFKWSVR